MSTAEPTTRRARRTQAEPPAQSDALAPPDSPPAVIAATELSLPERALAAMKLQVTVEQLTELAAKTADITTITNNDGRTQTHAAAMVLKEQRLVIERAGKAAREDATKFAKQVIVEADKLIALISPEEERLIKLRDEWDAAREAEKRAKAESERQRMLAIQQRIQDIRDMVAEAAGKPAAQIDEVIRTLTAIVVDDSFQEAKPAAEQVHANVLVRLRSLHDQQARIEQELAEQEAAAAKRRAELDAEIQRQREQRELQGLRLKRIAHINNLVLVATTGRADRKAGTRECITETLAEVRALLITEAEYGDMLDAAIGARDAAVQQIEHILQRFDARVAEQRVALIQRDIENDLRSVPRAMLVRSAADIQRTIADIEEIHIDQHRFQELVDVAREAKQQTLSQLRAMHSRQAAQEAEQERLDNERAAAQAEHARIAAENACKAEELRQQQAQLDLQRQEQEAQRAELQRQQEELATPAVAPVAEATQPDPEPVLTTAPVAAHEFAPNADQIADLVAEEWQVSFEQAMCWCLNAFEEPVAQRAIEGADLSNDDEVPA